MSQITEIRWHSRGGQGAMLAVRTLARAAINHGKYAQGMPEFGPERSGAPIRAYNRIADQKFSLYCAVVNPNVVIVLDPTLIETVNVADGLTKDGVVIVNTNQPAASVREKLKLANGQVYTLDATGISVALIGKPMPNTPILGALVKITGLLSLNELLDDIKQAFGEKFSPQVVEANLNAIKKGYEEVK
ncbi:MAG: 2-oxoacid:acceptor oxidoreductase family protein [Planctomycetota bacterium]